MWLYVEVLGLGYTRALFGVLGVMLDLLGLGGGAFASTYIPGVARCVHYLFALFSRPADLSSSRLLTTSH